MPPFPLCLIAVERSEQGVKCFAARMRAEARRSERAVFAPAIKLRSISFNYLDARTRTIHHLELNPS